MEKIIFIKTKKYSTFFKLLFSEYKSSFEIEIDDKSYTEDDLEWLISTWCTNNNIAKTLNFKLKRNNQVLFSFHDEPGQLFAACSELRFIEKMSNKNLLRYKILVKKPSIFLRLKNYFKRTDQVPERDTSD